MNNKRKKKKGLGMWLKRWSTDLARMRPSVQTPVLTINKYVNTLGLGIKATSRHEKKMHFLKM
jgi:hypothetical protein